jgi:hypothetical protein
MDRLRTRAPCGIQDRLLVQIAVQGEGLVRVREVG